MPNSVLFSGVVRLYWRAWDVTRFGDDQRVSISPSGDGTPFSIYQRTASLRFIGNTAPTAR
jgi:hypothetical protein